MEGYYDYSRTERETNSRNYVIRLAKEGYLDTIVTGANFAGVNHVSLDVDTFKIMVNLLKNMEYLKTP